jgi:hypothetical protein
MKDEGRKTNSFGRSSFVVRRSSCITQRLGVMKRIRPKAAIPRASAPPRTANIGGPDTSSGLIGVVVAIAGTNRVGDGVGERAAEAVRVGADRVA